MTLPRYINCEEWMRDWDAVLVSIIGGHDVSATSEPEEMIYIYPPRKPIFLNPDWELAVLPAYCLSDDTPDPGDEWDEDPNFIYRDEFEGFFTAMEKLQHPELIVTQVGHWGFEDIKPDETAVLCAATRQGVEGNAEVTHPGYWMHVFDRSGRWCMSSSSEYITVLGGDGAFMQAFSEASGGKQAVIDRMLAYCQFGDNDYDEEDAARLFPRLGWDYTPPLTL